MIELKSHPVAGYDGPKGSLFMVLEGGSATSDDGWRVDFSASVGSGATIAYVHDPSGKHVATYSVPIDEFCEEALRLAREKVAARNAA